MAVSEAKRRADNKYRASKTKAYGMRFFPTDMYLYDYIKSQPEGYVKGLVRADMEAHGVEVPEVAE